ncbi:hypothetical protein ACFY12_08885 [Streptomyces sp. NPDC001339]|uniref:hypothetical protein n=1 Tax=Streptomyces sp. NPDC001339 TaxID=3364563 RepID=UPI0036C32753
MKRNTLRIAAASALAAVTFGVATPMANAAPASAAPRAAAPVQGIGDAEGIKALERFAQAIQQLPKNLQNKNLNDPEVINALKGKLSTNSGSNGSVATRTNWLGCGVAAAKFAAENGIPVAKVARIVGKLGGYTKFAKYAWRYLKDGHVPPEAGEEFADFVMAVSGLGDLAAACA